MLERRLLAGRTRALDRLGLLQEVPSPELRRTARLAAHIARQPGAHVFAAVHLLDDEHQHRVASHGGLSLIRTPAADSLCIQVVDRGLPIYSSDASLEARFDGSPHTAGPDPVRLYYATPLRLSDGTTLGTVCVFSTSRGTLDSEQRDRLDDLAAQSSAHLEVTGLSRELAHLATHDPLTEVANRLLLSQRLEQALADPVRRPHEPALLLIDLDDFKTINDRHGHAAGDEVLRSVASRLQESVRGSDLVARLGGDEYAVLFVELPDPGRLDEVASRIAHAAAEPHHISGGTISCTVSVGRSLGRPHDLAYELLGRADADMYARKAQSVVPLQR